MGKYIEVDGDATRPQLETPDEIAVIPHVCNNIGAWGAGFTHALNKAFGNGPYQTYQGTSIPSPNGLKNFLGEISVCDVLFEHEVFVINMIAQSGLISKSNPKPIKYWALIRCMEKVREHIGLIKNDPDLRNKPLKIHCPKFGSELAGGKWEFIKELIMETWVDKDIDVVVYNYVP